MRGRVSKPRVFLSHSSRDKDFINRVAADLRKCQLDPWVDVEEIRDGRPWLKVIFEDSMPSCDAILAYFTENSLSSEMVAKEIDAAIISRLEDAGVSFLPYVSKDGLRNRLRIDIRSLQCRAWNDDNYHEILPSVVAEIWRSYLERKINEAVLQERNSRLETELKLNELQARFEASAFTPSEERDFQFIFNKLNRDIEMTSRLLRLENGRHVSVGEEVYEVNLISALIVHFNERENHFSVPNLMTYLSKTLDILRPLTDTQLVQRTPRRESGNENLLVELLTYGLVRNAQIQSFDGVYYTHEFTDKAYRLKYWLEFNNLIPGLQFNLVNRVQNLPVNTDADNGEDFAFKLAIDAEREVSFKEQREKWLSSKTGVDDARQEVHNLFDEVERLTRLHNEKLERIKIELCREADIQCSISCSGITMLVKWNCVSAESLKGSVLLVEQYKTKTDSNGQPTFLEGDRDYRSEYDIDINREMKVYWRWRTSRDRPLTSAELAREVVSHLWSTIRSKAIHGE